MENKSKLHWGIYAAMLAVFVVLLLVIPSERTFVFYAGLIGTAVMCAVAGIGGWRQMRRRKAQGLMPAWPDLFTMLAIQLGIFAFLDMGSVFCPDYIAVVAEAIVFVPVFVILVGEERLRDAVRWLYARRKAAVLTAVLAAVAIPALCFGIPFAQYKYAQGLLDEGGYEKAIAVFERLGDDYLDAEKLRLEGMYREGRRLKEAGETDRAYFMLQDIIAYSDVADYLAQDAELKAVRAKYEAYDIGNEVELGEWNGQPLKWGVLAQDGSRRLLIACESLARMKFNEVFDITYWENSSLRGWLNGEFLSMAFTDAERARLIETHVKNDDNLMYRTEAGKDTVDTVFLLSIDEAEIYRHINKEWFTSSTTSSWLRSPGCSRIDAANITMGGGVDEMGTNVDKKSGVQPVIWVDIAE